MNPLDSTRVLLGPQRPLSRLAEAIRLLGPGDGPVAVISAGWQEAEGDIDAVRDLVGRQLIDLNLYQRANELFHADTELHNAYRARQDELIEQQQLYGLRLRHVMFAVRQIMRAEGDPDMIDVEHRHALKQLRELDRHHNHCVKAIHAEYDEKFNADSYAPLTDQRADIQAVLNDCGAVILTGGNVIVLLNRLLLFAMGSMLKAKAVVAWSAGAMAVGQRVVLFHDRMPEGRRDAELLGPGLGLTSDLIVLPDARRRIRVKDDIRLSLFSQRFSPEQCVMLDNESLLQQNGDRIVAAESVRRIKANGGIGPVSVS